MKGKIFNIQRFSTQDGMGIRTVVFFKGCPLRCAWCHNPESLSTEKEILFNTESCINCGMCEKLCDRRAHTICDNQHYYDRKKCQKCGECVRNCVTDALEICGEEMDVDEVAEKVIRDIQFYKNTGGGLTLSGGEPLMQAEFALELVKKVKEKNINICMETSGFGKVEDLLKLKDYVDCFLYDIKLMDEEKHIQYTGVSNRIIQANLWKLDEARADIILRCPIIPDVNFNTEHFDSIARLANSLSSVRAINLEPYHPMGISKAIKLDKTQVYHNTNFLSCEELMPFVDKLKKAVKTEVEVLQN